MAIRTREQLRRDQTRILDAYRARRAGDEAAVLSGDGGGVSMVTVGKVTSVVTSDPTLGAHVVVQPQAFGGAPAAASAASRPAVVAYPTPNRAAGDYAVDEYVSLMVVHGAMLAGKLG